MSKMMKSIQENPNNQYLKALGILDMFMLVVFDQLTKHWAVRNLKDQADIVWIKDVFVLEYLENRGAAFGMLQGKRIFFLILTVIVVALIIYIYWKIPTTKKYAMARLTCMLLVGGALGNFVDRAVNAYVVDFFYFQLINFPIFNVADIYVTAACIALMISILFLYKEEDFYGILPLCGKDK